MSRSNSLKLLVNRSHCPSPNPLSARTKLIWPPRKSQISGQTNSQTTRYSTGSQTTPGHHISIKYHKMDLREVRTTTAQQCATMDTPSKSTQLTQEPEHRPHRKCQESRSLFWPWSNVTCTLLLLAKSNASWTLLNFH